MITKWIGAPSLKSETGNTVAICQAAKAQDTRPRVDWAFKPPVDEEKAEIARLRRKAAMQEALFEVKRDRLIARLERVQAMLATALHDRKPASVEELHDLAKMFNR